MTGVLPTKTSIQIRESDGSTGTIPSATPTAAGCMTAEHVRRLEALWLLHETGGGGALVMQPSVDTSAFVTVEQLRGLLARLEPQRRVPSEPRAPLPQVSGGEIAHVRDQVSDIGNRVAMLEMRPMPESDRAYLESIDHRLAIVEETLRDILERAAA